jgi:thiamine transport system substrate-binding protein
MKRLIPFLAALIVVLASCAEPKRELVVYTYDSFAADWGAGPKLAELFKKATGVTVTWRTKGDGGQLLADLALEGNKPGADLVVGLDNQLAPKALALDLFAAYKPKGVEALPPAYRFDPSNRLIPFDYGYFAIIYDSQKAKTLPRTLEDFANPRYAKQLILMDPRTSTPGLGFLAWTRAVYGAGFGDYWKRLKPAIRVMTPGWDAGYGLFTSGEAPFVLSYSTSPAYHREVEKSDRYKVLPLEEGSPLEIEAAAILKGGTNRRNAERFMDFLISREAQEVLPLTQWMYPVLPGLPLPASYTAAPAPVKVLAIDAAGLVEDAVKVMDIVATP